MGTLMTIWDPLDLNKLKVVSIPDQVNIGPSDDQINVPGFTIKPDQNGNFLEGKKKTYTDNELDAIHTYTIMRMVVNLYEGVLGYKINWNWNNQQNHNPLKAYISTFEHCCYSRNNEAVLFGAFYSASTKIVQCRSSDLVAHETAHAIVDSLKPKWYGSTIETWGVIESFCDLTSFFLKLSQKDLVEFVINKTNNNLKQQNKLAQFGDGLEGSGLRSAINDLTYDAALNDAYQYSNILTGAIYNATVNYYNSMESKCKTKSIELHEIGNHVMRLITEAILSSPKADVKIIDLAQIILNIAPMKMLPFIQFEFQSKKLL